MRELTIYGRRIADDEPCYVIAEIGNNHQGSVDTALDLIDAAADAGAHAVKFQRRTNATLYSRALLDQPYDNPASFGKTYGEHRAALELPLAAYYTLHQRAHDRGLAFIVTAFDELAAGEMAPLVDAFKLASGSLTDHKLIRYVATHDKPVILSTGGGGELDIFKAETSVVRYHSKLAILHCTASYPCAFDELSLRCIETLRRIVTLATIGWSSHDNGIAMAVAAYTLGARIIEKHFTLNRAMKGTDHAFSLEPAGLKKMCRDLERAHVAMGDGIKRYYESERKPIAKMRRRQTPEGLRITGELDAIR